MKTAHALLAGVAMLALSPGSKAEAHSMAIGLSLAVRGGSLTAGAVALGGSGAAVAGLRLEVVLTDGAGRAWRADLSETGRGEYRSPAPALPPGDYTLRARDTTPGFEPAQAEVAVRWPPAAPVDLTLPPTADTTPSGLMVAVLLTPVLAAAGVLAWVLLRRPPPG